MKKYLLTTLSIIITCIVGINSAKSITDHNMHVVICDVGQGDGIILITPLRAFMLIDAGPDNKMEACVTRFKPFYDHSLNTIIISHFHADHITGFLELLKSYHINTVIKDELKFISSEKAELEKEVLTETEDIHELWQGDQIEVEQGVTLHVLWPEKESWNRSNGNWEAYLNDFNDSSLVLLLKYNAVAVLLTGDVGTDILDKLSSSVSFNELIKNTLVRIYKVPHHGSRDANSIKMLEVFNPTTAIISAGKDNKFNHPHKETLETLKKMKIPYLITSEKGTIEFTFTESEVRVRPDR